MDATRLHLQWFSMPPFVRASPAKEGIPLFCKAGLPVCGGWKQEFSLLCHHNYGLMNIIGKSRISAKRCPSVYSKPYQLTTLPSGSLWVRDWVTGLSQSGYPIAIPSAMSLDSGILTAFLIMSGYITACAWATVPSP